MAKRIILYLLFSLAVGAVLYSLSEGITAPSALFMAITISSGVIMGGVIANLAVFIAVTNSPIINNLKKTGHYMNIVQNIYITAAALLATLLAGLCSLLGTNYYIHWLTTVLFVFALLNLFSTGIKFYKVVRLVSQPKGNPNILE